MTENPTDTIPSSLRPYLDEIAARLLSGHAACMVGSGFSRNAARLGSGDPFPDWSELGNRFYNQLHGHGPGPEDNYLQVPVLAHEIEAAFGRPKLNQMLRDAIPDLMHEPSPLHTALLNLPWSDVLTTNYDTLIERACRSVIARRYDIIVNPKDLGDSRRPRIIKLHGTLPTHRPFIVTDEDYRKYPDDFAPFVNTALQALLENTLCLIGFSGDDPNFLQWIGWIHDNLGLSKSRKMYLIGVLSLSHSQRMLLESRNIIPVDMSEWPGVGGDHYQGLAKFFDYLERRKHEEDSLMWPRADSTMTANNSEGEIADVVADWKRARVKYPGWVVVPEDRRRVLWEGTRKWIERLPSVDALPSPLDLEFAFELTWRTEKSLVPIFDNHAALLEAVLSTYWPVESTAVPPASVDGDADDFSGTTVHVVKDMCHHLLLRLMRYYREEGLATKWRAALARITAVKDALPPELAARLHHERAMFALFALNLDELKRCVEEWQESDAHPFWNAKKAAVMAEIGFVEEAERLLEVSLEAIRAKSNLMPTHNSYTLASQESYVMFVRQAAQHHRRFATGEASAEARQQDREYSGRWHVLRQYKCDPWHELEAYRHSLQRPPAKAVRTEETPTFDIGRITRRHSMAGYDVERFTAYNFLRFCEDAAIPFKVANVSVAAPIAAGTLPRIAAHSSYWALATLVRTGDTAAVEEIYDRASLARMDSRAVDGLITLYVGALRRAAPDIELATRVDEHRFGDQMAGVVPEILSRLCCKCSYHAKEEIIELLFDLYQSEYKRKFVGVRSLTWRLLESMTVQEQVALIPKLLRFPVIGETNHFVRQEFVNPLGFVRSLRGRTIDRPMNGHDLLPALVDRTASEDPSIRRWAVTTLGQLHHWGLLTGGESASFGQALWSQTDEWNMPAGTDYPRWAFLRLPHPENVDPVQVFVEYVRNEPFPAQQRPTKTAIGMGPVELCIEIEMAAEIPWTTADMRSIVGRLIAWWNTDRSHLKRAVLREEKEDASGWMSFAEALRGQMRQLVKTLAIVVGRQPLELDEVETRDALRRMVTEMAEEDVPTLVLEMACATLFPEWREKALREMESHNASTADERVVDAFTAIRMEAERAGRHDGRSQEEHDKLRRLMRVVGDAIRWRGGTALVQAIQTMGVLVERHPWGFEEDVEGMVLSRLGGLISDTTLDVSGAATLHRGESREEVAEKLLIRRESAALAYRLSEVYLDRGVACPEPVIEWEKVCRSADEFAEIRREWLDWAGRESVG